MTGLPNELRSHRWVDSYEKVSVDGDAGLYVVRLDTQTIPGHMVNSEAFDVHDVWIDTVPTAFWLWIPDSTCRKFGFGRVGLSMMIEVPADD